MAGRSRYCKKYRFIKKETQRYVLSSHDSLSEQTNIVSGELSDINEPKQFVMGVSVNNEDGNYNNDISVEHYGNINSSSNLENVANCAVDNSVSFSSNNSSLVLANVSLSHRHDEFLHFIKSWSIDNNIKFSQLNALLSGINSIIPELHLPKDARTILQTKRLIKLNTLMSSKGNKSEFFYLGISYMLAKYFRDDYLCAIMLQNDINLSFNIDGLPLFKSASTQLWPILCKIHLKNVKVTPFVVAIYCGDSKPLSLMEYLKEFIFEINKLCLNGFNNIPVHIFCISCDAPARAYLKGIKGHNGFYGCERCIQKGHYVNNRIVYLEKNSILRTNQNFRNKSFPEHHQVNTPLTDITSIDMIHSFPLDYMHLCCLGIMRKLLNYWFRGSTSNHSVRLRVDLRMQLCKRLQYYAKFMPSDFNRKCRSLNELDRFKAVEFRFIMLYIGPILLKNVLSTNLYEHFLLFHCAMRILLTAGSSNTEWINTAKEMLGHFVEKMVVYYGPDACIYNVHSLLHVADDCLHLKETLNEFSCFPFESYLGSLKYMLRGPHRPCAQICKRLYENSYITYEKLDETSIITNKNLKYITFSKFKIKLNEKDCYVFINTNKIFKITNIVDEHYVEGFTSSKLQNLYDYPIPSEELGLYKFKTFSHLHVDTINISQIQRKCLVIYCDNNFVGMDLLHLI